MSLKPHKTSTEGLIFRPDWTKISFLYLYSFFCLFVCLHITETLVGEGNGSPLQYSCLENPTDRGAWWAAVGGVAKSRTRLSDFTFTFHFYALEKEMATHFSVLAWRISGTGEPGGLLSMGSHRVGHDWSDLAAAAAAAETLVRSLAMLKRIRPGTIKLFDVVTLGTKNFFAFQNVMSVGSILKL